MSVNSVYLALRRRHIPRHHRPARYCELLGACDLTYDLFVVSLSLIEKQMENLRLIAKVFGSVRWDCTSQGEGMLRFDPSEDRIHTARTPGVSEDDFR
jgi:hypothetical protein